LELGGDSHPLRKIEKNRKKSGPQHVSPWNPWHWALQPQRQFDDHCKSMHLALLHVIEYEKNPSFWLEKFENINGDCRNHNANPSCLASTAFYTQ
jgi:hypothetical protein